MTGVGLQSVVHDFYVTGSATLQHDYERRTQFLLGRP